MANEVKDNVVKMDQDATEEVKEETKTEETANKEFWLIRGAKAVWHGAKSAGEAINGFVHKHPYVTAGLTTAAGYVIKIGVDLLNGGNSEDVSDETPRLELPEPEEDDYVEPEVDEPDIDINLPEMETTTEE